MQDIENEIRNLVAEIIEKDPSEIKPDGLRSEICGEVVNRAGERLAPDDERDMADVSECLLAGVGIAPELGVEFFHAGEFV